MTIRTGICPIYLALAEVYHYEVHELLFEHSIAWVDWPLFGLTRSGRNTYNCAVSNGGALSDIQIFVYRIDAARAGECLETTPVISQGMTFNIE